MYWIQDIKKLHKHTNIVYFKKTANNIPAKIIQMERNNRQI